MPESQKKTAVIGPGHARLPLFIACAGLDELIAKIRERDTGGECAGSQQAAKCADFNEAAARACFEERGYAVARVGEFVHISADKARIQVAALFGEMFFHTMTLAQGAGRLGESDSELYRAQSSVRAQQSDITSALYGYFQEHILPPLANS